MTTDIQLNRFPGVLIALGLGILMAGAAMMPLIRYANPRSLAIGGVLVASAIVIGTWKGSLRPKRLSVLVPLIGGLGLLLWTGLSAAASMKDFDRVCGELQQTMLTNVPASGERGSRPVDQFRAMGCRP